MRIDSKKLIISCLLFLVLSLAIIGVTHGVQQYFAGIGESKTNEDKPKAASNSYKLTFYVQKPMIKSNSIVSFYMEKNGVMTVTNGEYNYTEINAMIPTDPYVILEDNYGHFSLAITTSVISNFYFYEFSGFFADEQCTTIYNFSAPLTEDKNVYICREINSCTHNAQGTRGCRFDMDATVRTIDYDLDGGSSDYSTLKMFTQFGSKGGIQLPPAPTKQGYVFLGWYSEKQKQYISTGDHIVAQSQLVAKWGEAIRVRYGYERDGYTEKIRVYNDNISFPTDLQNEEFIGKTQYVAGWYYESGSRFQALTDDKYTTAPANGYVSGGTGNRSITLYGKILPKKKITKHIDNETTEIDYAKPGASYSARTVSKPLFTFVGWFYDSDHTNPVTFPIQITESMNNFDIYAYYEPHQNVVTHSVTYLQGYGTNDTIKVDVVEENYSYFVSEGPERDGYDFTGWNTQYDGSGTSYSPGDDLTGLTENLELHAQWKEKTPPTPPQPVYYTVTFNSNGGPSVSSQRVEAGSYATEPKPTRTGYTLEGWYSAKTGGTKFKFTTAINSDKELFAHWKANNYTITLNTNEGLLEGENTITVTYDKTFDNLPIPTKTGYKFVGWYLDENLTYSSRLYESKQVAITENKTAYARWVKVVETTTYGDINKDGSINNSDITALTSFITGKSNVTDINVLNSLDVNGDGSIDELDKDDLSNYVANPSRYLNTLPIYPINAPKVTVTFDYDGGESTILNKIVVYNSVYGTLPTPTRGNDTFLGWFYDKLGNKEASANDIVDRTDNHTLYAKWLPSNVEQYLVSYLGNGGTGAPERGTKVKDVDYTISNIIPTRNGYTFDGWALSEYGDAVYHPGDVYTANADLVLFAAWKDNSFSLEQVSNYTVIDNDKVVLGVKVKPEDIKANEGYTLTYIKAQGKTDTTYVGTGDSLKLYRTSEPENFQLYTIMVKGDANGDGRVTAKDYKAVKKHVMGTSLLTGIYKTAADINKDNKITANDYKKIKRYVMKGEF